MLPNYLAKVGRLALGVGRRGRMGRKGVGMDKETDRRGERNKEVGDKCDKRGR